MDFIKYYPVPFFKQYVVPVKVKIKIVRILILLLKWQVEKLPVFEATGQTFPVQITTLKLSHSYLVAGCVN